jgi:phospholipid/cholesterol/gamma-HCH transport system substrate-binding protein
MRGHRGREAGIIALLAAMCFIGLATGAYIVAHQNAEFPDWLPLVGDDFVELHGEMETAQGVIPGQGQPVEVAGVIVGRVSDARLVKGRAVLDLHLEPGKVKLFRDASLLLRPRTLLKDMILQLTPGTPAAGELEEGDTIPISNTLPDVNVDDLLTSLDVDTRDALVSLAQAAGQGLDGQGRALSSVLRRFDPTMRQLERISSEVAGRRRELARVVTNFSRISRTLARHRGDLTRFVGSTEAVFSALAAEQRSLRSALRELPSTLRELRTSTAGLAPTAASLGSASRRLLPGARALGPGARALEGMFSGTTGVLRDRLRPFARATRGPLSELRRATNGLAQTSVATRGAGRDLNRFFDRLAYSAPGSQGASRVLWAAWSAHQLNSMLSTQDALGPFAHTLTLTSCASLRLLPGFIAASPAFGLTASLANLPEQKKVCP